MFTYLLTPSQPVRFYQGEWGGGGGGGEGGRRENKNVGNPRDKNILVALQFGLDDLIKRWDTKRSKNHNPLPRV